MRRTASAEGPSRSNASSTSDADRAGFVICVDPRGHDDLQARRVYRALPDRSAARSEFVRVIDDSGEDYLYPAACFLPVSLPRTVQRALAEGHWASAPHGELGV